jgi:hypothetical protein
MTRLISEGLDRRLPWTLRFRVRLHLLLCVSCDRFRLQVLFLRESVRRFLAAERNGNSPLPSLPPEARERIRRALERETS